MRLEILCQNRLGLAQDVLNILVGYQLDLRGIEVDPSLNKIYVSFPSVDFEQFQELMAKMRRINGVTDVKTTAFLPSEREHNELVTLLRTLPDGLIAIDIKANVTVINDAALEALSVAQADIVGQSLQGMVKGFNFLRWLEGDDVLAQTRRFEIHGKRFIADILPVLVPDDTGKDILAGAVINSITGLSSEFLQMTRGEFVDLTLTALSVAVLVVGGSLAAQASGATGMAMVVSAVMAGRNLLAHLYCRVLIRRW